MTKKQLELLQFIEAFIGTNGYSPSFEEMRVAIGAASKSAVFRLVNGLEEQGRIRRLRNRNRAIEVVKDPEIPMGLRQFTNWQLADEAKRRHLVLCHRMRDPHGTIIYAEV